MRNPIFCHMGRKQGADQPVHPPSLISDFAVRFLDSIIPILGKYSNFQDSR